MGTSLPSPDSCERPRRRRLGWSGLSGKRFIPVLVTLGQLFACQGEVGKEDSRSQPTLSFLTRKGCVKSPAMYANLETALAQIGWSSEITIVDLGTLEQKDPRTGYGTPTVLVKGEDLFGMAVPEPAAPA